MGSWIIKECRANGQSKKKSVRTGNTCPWQRDGADLCEKARQRSGGTFSVPVTCTAWEKLDHERKKELFANVCVKFCLWLNVFPS